MNRKMPYVIAEMGVNFYDTANILGVSAVEAAKIYIDQASGAGIDCAKFQAYKAATIASKYSPAYWDTTKEKTKTQYELFKKYDSFGREDYEELQRYTHSKGMDFTATPFDYESADFLEPLVDFYKISSSDITNIPFIQHIGRKGKCVVISVGASYLSEVDEAIRALKDSGCKDIVIMYCVLSYPTKPENANLGFIKGLKRDFPNIEIGYSDHVPPDENMITLSAAYMLGAGVIEKHFTLDKTAEGNDHYHAGDPEDFRKAIHNFKRLNELKGLEEKTVLPCEYPAREEARRSIVLAKDMKKGEIIKKSDVVAKRPGRGIQPKYIDLVVGRTIRYDLSEDTILRWDMI